MSASAITAAPPPPRLCTSTHKGSTSLTSVSTITAAPPPCLCTSVPHPPSHELAAMRRATYPYVRQDRDASAPYSQAPFMPQDCEPIHSPSLRPDTLYGEPLPLMDNSPQLISFGPDNHSFHHGHYDMSVSSSPASSYIEFDNLEHNVKLEESAPVIVPSQTCLYRPPSSGAMHAPHVLSSSCRSPRSAH